MKRRVSLDKSWLSERETTRDELLAKFRKEEFNDIFLEGKDGVRVPANRCILAARSDVFQKMLLGDFAEATQKVIPVDYNGNVLQAMVEYILTDAATAVLVHVDSKEDDDREVTPTKTKHIQSLVGLACAAAYFDLPVLCERSFNTISHSLEDLPALAFATLEASHQESSSLPSIRELAMSYIKSGEIKLDNAYAVAMLTPSTMEEILKEEEMLMEEYELFKILHLWVEAQDKAGKDSTVTHASASTLVTHIRLEFIDTSVLADSVAESGLVSREQLAEAFKIQALVAQERHGVTFNRARLSWSWLRAGTKLSCPDSVVHCGDVVKCHPMTSGIHQWVLEVLEEAHYTWLGVALVEQDGPDLDKPLFDQEGAWMIGSSGFKVYNKNFMGDFQRFGKYSRVTLTLNLLTEGDGGGTLSVAIDDGEPFTVFENMRHHLEGQVDGFVPAVSLRKPGRVRLLGIVQLRK